ncbi:hypothetical protein K435DRAFT_221953 [Dendrothele bispora CBS 962.96]|uniref:Uncharacterized protein n=1 Tax=Dendrothele bispora (strain CBS 962.96) TaxID=1314807 RepID=A0A4S8LR50_DENBC|nr:hypothetical protein K435DRAFT_221953 [Dendrothele bispora CBS 962.96]
MRWISHIFGCIGRIKNQEVPNYLAPPSPLRFWLDKTWKRLFTSTRLCWRIPLFPSFTMSGASPSRKLRSKTAEFLRGSSNQARQVQAVYDVDDHELSRVVELDHDPSPKKRGSRIPFMGRGRKKSLQSDHSGQEVQEGRTSAATTRSKSLLDEQAGLLTAQPRASTSNPSLPTSVQPTFGSKFAAHFTSGKSKGLLSYTRSVKKRAKTSGTETDYASDSLAAGRPTSVDSKTSRRSRSATPRPSQAQPVAQPPPVQPTITVSSPTDPNGLDEYEGLFTKPRHKIKAKPTSRENPASPYHSSSTSLSNPTSEADSTQLPSGLNLQPDLPDVPTSGNSTSKRSSVVSVASVSSYIRSSHKQSSAARRFEDAFGIERDLDSAEESEAVSMLSVKSLPVASSLRSRKSSSSSATITSVPNDKRRSNTMSRRNPALSLASSQPPSIPLPLPPLTSPPLVPPTPPPQTPLPSLPAESSSVYMRPRAHTISSSLSGSSSIPDSSAQPVPSEGTNKSSLKRHKTTASPSFPLSKSQSPTPSESSPDDTIVSRGSGSSSSSSSTPTLTKPPSPDPPHSPPPSPKFPPSPIADSDLDTASVNQLREALRLRNVQFDELISYMHKQSEHRELERKWLESKIASAETDKKVLEGKIISLEREAVRRDKEIKGLTWLVMNNRGPGGLGGIADPAAAIRAVSLSARSTTRAGGTSTIPLVLSNSSTSTTSAPGTGTPDLGTSDDSSARSLSTVPTPSSSFGRLPIYRKIQIGGSGRQDDSGGESGSAYLTSTSMDGEGEVVSAPETSRPSRFSFSTSPNLKPRRTMRKLKLVESVNSRNLGQSSLSDVSQPLSFAIPDDVPYLLKPNKRTSSSASSTSTPSPPISPKSPDATLSNFPSSTPTLSAIPETSSSSSPGQLGDSKSKDRERKSSISKVSFSLSHSNHHSTSGRSSTSSNSVSSSFSPSGPSVPPKPKTPTKSSAKFSSASPTPQQSQRLTPSEAYALNLKKGRPPSIAQVLDKGLGLPSGSPQATSSTHNNSGLMEESFGGRSRALLGLTGSGLKAVKNAGTVGSGKS